MGSTIKVSQFIIIWSPGSLQSFLFALTSHSDSPKVSILQRRRMETKLERAETSGLQCLQLVLYIHIKILSFAQSRFIIIQCPCSLSCYRRDLHSLSALVYLFSLNIQIFQIWAYSTAWFCIQISTRTVQIKSAQWNYHRQYHVVGLFEHWSLCYHNYLSLDQDNTNATTEEQLTFTDMTKCTAGQLLNIEWTFWVSLHFLVYI